MFLYLSDLPYLSVTCAFDMITEKEDGRPSQEKLYRHIVFWGQNPKKIKRQWKV